MIIKAGTLLTISSGEYSDYRYTGPFIVLKDIDQKAVADEFRQSWRPTADSWRTLEDGPDCDEFLPWLHARGYVEDVEGSVGWHVGNYGFAPTILPEPTP